jgi:hypothetical protein
MTAPATPPEETTAMRLPRVRFTVRGMMAEVAFLAVFLSVAIPLGRFQYRLQKKGDLVRSLGATLRGLRTTRPASVSPVVWEETLVWTGNIGEDLYCDDGIPVRSRERLIEALRLRLQGPVGPELIPWIWDEYTAMARGTCSEGFVRGYRCTAVLPVLRDALSVRPPDVAPGVWGRATRETTAALEAFHVGHGGGNAPRSVEEERFLGSVAAILTRPLGRGRLLSVWERLAESGPAGRDYAGQRLASLRRDLEGAGGVR